MRMQMLGIALTGLFLGSTNIGLWLIIFFMVLLGIMQGITVVMMNSLRAKVIPVHRRGFVAGWRNFLSNGATAIVAYFAGGYLIDNNILGDGYAALFLLAFFIALLGIIVFIFTKEPTGIDLRKRENIQQSFKSLKPLFRTNPHFARFFLVTVLGSIGRMAMPFYILFAGTRMELSGAMLGLLTTIWMLSGTVTNLLWGEIADRKGYRVVMIITLALWVIADCQLLVIQEVYGVLIFFVVFGIAISGFNQARMNMVLELGSDADIPLRVAASNMASNTVGAIGPLLGGLIVLAMGYEIIFIICILVQSVALVIMLNFVPEPRSLEAVSYTHLTLPTNREV